MTEKKKFRLPNKKVMVKPILRKGKWLKEGHVGNFLYDDARITIVVPLNEKTGALINPLTSAEQSFFENKSLSGLDFEPGDLSAHKQKDNFWERTEVKLEKPESVVSESSTLMTLDLSNPIEYLYYKILLANSGSGGIVSPSYDEKFSRASYRIMIVEKDHEAEKKANKGEKLGKVYAYFNSINNSVDKMYEFLSIYYLLDQAYSKPSKNASKSWYKSAIQDLIESPKGLSLMLDIIDNEDEYSHRVFVLRAIDSGDITYNENGYELVDGTPIGGSLVEAVKFFKDAKNSEIKMKIQARLEDDNE